MVTVKARQKLFTSAEAASLTGICAEHLSNTAKRFRLGFIARYYEAAAKARRRSTHTCCPKRATCD